jgi:predicted N-acetyltransferase YhbS
MGRVAGLSAPEKLTAAHDLSRFACGERELDEWLRRRAIPNEEQGASRSYVVCVERRVVGFYALAAGAADHTIAPGRVKRNMPNPVPVIVIGRLAIDLEFQGQGIGLALLRDAVLRTVEASKIAGIRAILVHAISESAKRFYERFDFIPSPVDSMTLMIPVAEADSVLREKP